MRSAQNVIENGKYINFEPIPNLDCNLDWLNPYYMHIHCNWWIIGPCLGPEARSVSGTYKKRLNKTRKWALNKKQRLQAGECLNNYVPASSV